MKMKKYPLEGFIAGGIILIGVMCTVGFPILGELFPKKFHGTVVSVVRSGPTREDVQRILEMPGATLGMVGFAIRAAQVDVEVSVSNQSEVFHTAFNPFPPPVYRDFHEGEPAEIRINRFCWYVAHPHRNVDIK